MSRAMSRCILKSMAHTNERVVAGVREGLLVLGDEVTWEGTHLLVKQRLTSRITAFEPPLYFRDSLVRGAFRRFDHDHFFQMQDSQTIMKDVFNYQSPLGLLGKLANMLVVNSYMTTLLQTRAEVIKSL